MSKKLLTVLPLGLIIVFVINNQFIKSTGTKAQSNTAYQDRQGNRRDRQG